MCRRAAHIPLPCSTKTRVTWGTKLFHSLLITACDVDARDLLLLARDEVADRAGLAGKAVLAVPAHPYHIALPEGLGDATGTDFDHLFRLGPSRRGYRVGRVILGVD